MRLESLLELRGIPFERHIHDATYTAQELAEAEHVSGHMIAKPVIVKGWSGYAMCVVPASKRLDLARAADALRESEVSLANESEMARLFPGCELGAEPPVGGLFGMMTVMDRRLEQDEFLIMQAGTHSEAIKMRRRDYEDLCDPIIAPLTRS